MNEPKPAIQKFNLRMPRDLMETAQAQAEAMGISLNAYIILAVQNFVPTMARKLHSGHLVTVASVTPTRAARAVSPSKTTSRPVKVGRNEPCPCGSGRKAKHCHPENC